jgi:hypothetical protein
MYNCHHLSCTFPVLSQVNSHVICLSCHFTELVNLFTKVFIFLRNMLLENNSPFEEHSNVITAKCLDVCHGWSKFSFSYLL